MTPAAAWDLASRLRVVPVVDLSPDPRNARKHGEKNLAAIEASLREFKQRRALVVQKAGDKLVVRAGNGTLTAMKRLGWTHASVVVFEEGDDEAIRYALADNRTAELAEWDDDALADMLNQVGHEKAAELGFDAEEIEDLCRPFDEPVEADETSLPGTAGAAFQLKEDWRAPTAGALELPIVRGDMLMDPPNPKRIPQAALMARPFPGGLADSRKTDAVRAASPGPILHTWTEDHYFLSLFDDPARAFGRWLSFKPTGFVGIDYSTWIEYPFAVRLWAVYRSLWCTRYGQEAGMRCWLNYNPLHDRPVESVETMPRGAYVAVSMQTDYPQRKGYLDAWEAGLDALKPCGVLFYGVPRLREPFYNAAKKIAKRVDVAEPEYVARSEYSKRVREQDKERTNT